MRISVIGGTGFIGTRLVAQLMADGHEVVAASRATGVNSYTGEGLAEALTGTKPAPIDVSNSDYLDVAAANEFFYGSTLNLLTYGAAAEVSHMMLNPVRESAAATAAIEPAIHVLRKAFAHVPALAISAHHDQEAGH
jgi:uncharacterized protein YbjT (DUF2867 family)